MQSPHHSPDQGTDFNDVEAVAARVTEKFQEYVVSNPAVLQFLCENGFNEATSFGVCRLIFMAGVREGRDQVLEIANQLVS